MNPARRRWSDRNEQARTADDKFRPLPTFPSRRTT